MLEHARRDRRQRPDDDVLQDAPLRDRTEACQQSAGGMSEGEARWTAHLHHLEEVEAGRRSGLDGAERPAHKGVGKSARGPAPQAAVAASAAPHPLVELDAAEDGSLGLDVLAEVRDEEVEERGDNEGLRRRKRKSQYRTRPASKKAEDLVAVWAGAVERGVSVRGKWCASAGQEAHLG